MAEPEHTTMHNFAYHPSVASWVQSTALAQLDGASDEVTERSPDDFYKSPFTPPTALESSPLPDDMTTTRQRQQTSNGAPRSTPKPSIRSVSGPATSTAPRATPQLPGNRPTVRSLAQKFNQPSSAESSPSAPRARPVRPSTQARSTHTRSMVDSPASQASASSPARPAKEASYGAYKFNNLKPRERPQPAPPSPAGVRRANGGRTSVDKQTPPARRKLSSPTRGTARQPFFGEVVGEHNASSPGYGIPTLESALEEPNSTSHPAETSTIKIVTEESQLLPEGSHAQPGQARHQRPASEMTSGSQQSQATENRTPRRRSPPSRIPVATRRMSAASDSSSSTRSLRFGSARPVGGYNRLSPTRQRGAPAGRAGSSPKKSKPVAQPTLPAGSYRGYRERGKPAPGPNSGPSVPAVISAPLPPTSPRLRNSRERQTLQESPGSRSADAHASGQDYFGNDTASTVQQPQMTESEHADGGLLIHDAYSATENASGLADGPDRLSTPQQPVSNGQDSSVAPMHSQSLSLHTQGLQVQPPAQPTSSTTDFEYDESPVLGMPGSFMMTPPIVQHTPPAISKHEEQQKAQPPPVLAPEGEFLPARAFCPPSKEQIPEISHEEGAQEVQSEFGLRESIPIMLGSDGPHAGWNAVATRSRHSPRLSIGAHRWRAEPLDSTGTISYLEEDDSPIDPFAHRDSLRPDDSASVAFYRQTGQRSPHWTPKMGNVPEAGSFTLDSEAYSVINKVLNMYHGSDMITPEMAHDSREQVQSVSPIIAQHKDWGSKEATETYLARLLSDAAGSEERRDDEASAATEQPSGPASQSVPALSIRDLAEDPEEPIVGGTAIIFPPESRRYSRGSGGSTTTTIWEGPSRPDSSSGPLARDQLHGNAPLPLALAPHPPPKDWSNSPANHLPEIAGAGEGLGLSLQSSLHVHHHQQQHHQQQADEIQQQQQPPPPKPAYSPPPPPRPHVLSRNNTQEEATDMGQVLSKLRREDAAEARPAEKQSVAEVNGNQQLDPTTAGLRKRYRVIEELTKTEHSFCIDMMVAHNIFELTAGEVMEDKDRRTLFSNCKDLEKFSHALWQSLKDAIKPIVNQAKQIDDQPYDEFINCTPDNDRNVDIGAVMLRATPRMERLYTTYYLNHEDATNFIKKHSNNAELLGWVLACFQHSAGLTNAWDLDSLLVKPCQRMLKYHMLLEQLLDATDPDHPDLPQLKAAYDGIKQIGERINMAKKRQETLRAATSEGKKQKNKGRFGKSIVKALISNKDRAKQLQEAATIFEDQEYNSVTQKFGGHFFQIQIVIRDFDNYLDSITDQMLQLNIVMLAFVTMSEVGPSANPEMESTWRRWAMGYLELQNKALDEHKTAVRDRVMKPISQVWDQWVGPQKLMEERKKALVKYAEYKRALERKEKVSAGLEEAASDFLTVNDALKQELPQLYELTKKCIRTCQLIFLYIQKDWYKTCSKKILPLLESEPQHTTSITYDYKTYVDRFRSDWRQMEDRANSLAIVNHELLNNAANFTSPVPTFYSDDGSSRKSSSRRTESVSSEMSMINNRNRNSGGYGSTRSGMTSFEGPPRSSPAAPYPGPSNFRERGGGAISPRSETSEATITQARRPAWTNLDGTIEDPYAVPPSIGASFLNPAPSGSNPGSSRVSGVFNSALPMSDSPSRPVADTELPATPGEMDEPEVLFLAASLFEFNIAHDRREGGIPYLVYVPGEIFDVIGMKGELWLARNQDDPTRTVGWIWEKHFARILPEEV